MECDGVREISSRRTWVVCDEIERDLAIRYETPRVCYHLMMGRTRDNLTRAVARWLSVDVCAPAERVARALWRGFVARRDRRVARLDSECRRLATCDDPTGTSALGAFTRGGAYTFKISYLFIRQYEYP